MLALLPRSLNYQYNMPTALLDLPSELLSHILSFLPSGRTRVGRLYRQQPILCDAWRLTRDLRPSGPFAGYLTICTRLYPLAQAALYEELVLHDGAILQFMQRIRDVHAEHRLAHSRSLCLTKQRHWTHMPIFEHYPPRFACITPSTVFDDLHRLASEYPATQADFRCPELHALAWLLSRAQNLRSLTLVLPMSPRSYIEYFSAVARTEYLTQLRVQAPRILLVDWLPLLYRAANTLVCLSLSDVIGDPALNPDTLPCPVWAGLKELEITYQHDIMHGLPEGCFAIRFFASVPNLETLSLQAFHEAVEGRLLLSLGSRLRRLHLDMFDDYHWNFHICGQPFEDICPRLEDLIIASIYPEDEFCLSSLPRGLEMLSVWRCSREAFHWLQQKLEDHRFLPNVTSLELLGEGQWPSQLAIDRLNVLCDEREIELYWEESSYKREINAQGDGHGSD